MTSCNRVWEVPIGPTALRLPCFFPSISSLKSPIAPADYLKFMKAVGHPQYLFSAYDLAHSSTDLQHSTQEIISLGLGRRQVVLLDSGNYESYWLQDRSWQEESYADALRGVNVPLAFCFDSQCPSSDPLEIAIAVESAVLRHQGHYGNTTILPIVHGSPLSLPEAVMHVADRLRPLLLAVPERELGEGIGDRCMTITRIRRALGKLDDYYPLHLLGTGHPLSILAYVAAGADSFDGLEWCQAVASPMDGRLFDLSHLELVLGTQEPSPEVTRLPYVLRTLAHNLEFYEDWMSNIRHALEQESLLALVEKYLPDFKGPDDNLCKVE